MPLSAVGVHEIQLTLCAEVKQRRKKLKISREKLSLTTGVPAPTIKKFEATGQISLRQFLLLWLTLEEVDTSPLCHPNITLFP